MSTTIAGAPVVTLSNGLRVANFSSPHPFNFEDGSVLGACAPDRVEAAKLEREDVARPWGFWDRDDIVAVVPKFSLSDQVWNLLVALEEDSRVDIVLVPYPVLEALRNTKRAAASGGERPLLDEITKAGTICVKDRLTKVIFVNRFCR